MTIIDAINRIDSLKPNGYTQSEKVKWLGVLDGRIKAEILDRYNGAKEYTEYTDETAITTPLLVESPYDDIYLYWLEAQIDYWNGEYVKYNNSMDMFNTAYDAFAKQYNRTHSHKGTKFKFF